MRPLQVERYKQDRSHCAVASSASVANYYNKTIDYQFAKEVAYEEISNEQPFTGLDSYENGLLLNLLGFKKVKIITSDLEFVDYTWAGLSKKKQIEAISTMLKTRRIESHIRETLKDMFRFLSNEVADNELIIDRRFKDHICETLDQKKPLILSYNWNMMWKFPKADDNDIKDFIGGSYSYHAVCCRGYDKRGVQIVDSHHEFYKRKLKNLRSGYYFVSWEDLLTTMGSGDLVIPEDYDENVMRYELKADQHELV